MEEEVIDAAPVDDFMSSTRPAEYDEFLAGLGLNRSDDDLLSTDLSRLRTPTYYSTSNNNQMLNEDPSSKSLTSDLFLSLADDEDDSDYVENEVTADSPQTDPEELRVDNAVKISR